MTGGSFQRCAVVIATPAPAFALLDDSGHLYTLGDLLSQGGPIVLAFVSPGSAECLRAEAGFAQAAADGLRVLRVVPGDVADGLGGLRQVGREVMDSYAVRALPSAVIIDANGWVASALATGAEAIVALLGRKPGTAPLVERIGV